MRAAATAAGPTAAAVLWRTPRLLLLLLLLFCAAARSVVAVPVHHTSTPLTVSGRQRAPATPFDRAMRGIPQPVVRSARADTRNHLESL